MKLDSGSFSFNVKIEGKAGGTPSWGTAIVRQNEDNKIKEDIATDILIGMTYKKIDCTSHELSLPMGKGGHVYYGNENYTENGAPAEPFLAAKFEKVYVNGTRITKPFILLIVKDRYDDHHGRLQLKYSPKISWGDYKNQEFVDETFKVLGIAPEAPLVFYSIEIVNQDTLHFRCVYKKEEYTFKDSKEFAQFVSKVSSSPFSPSTLIEKIKSTGLIYSDDLIKRFAYALMTKPFVILSGLAGSGKTQLALAFAECMSEDVERQVRVVSVGADWTNREPLLGYPNALKSNEYVMPECGALDMLIEAHENPSKPYFLILDEMNLSVVERYFADFLSAMESKKPIALWKGAADGESESRVPNEIMLPQNLYIIGTINVDETTYMFSPKVLDRAHVIEFKIAAEEMASFLEDDKMVNRHACHGACAGMAEDFLARTNACAVGADTTGVRDTLSGFFKELKSVNAEFGYRTASEIYRYINNVGDELGEHGAIDTAILQKLLPKLHGSRKKLSPVLSALWKLCFAENDGISIESVKDFAEVNGLTYKATAEKIHRMYKAVVDNGFTSFAEA